MLENEIDFYQYGYKQYDYLNDEIYKSWDDNPEGFEYDQLDLMSKGYRQARKDFLSSYVVEAMSAYGRFVEEYNVSVSTGCGCCDAGWYITIDKIEYYFNPKDFTNV